MATTFVNARLIDGTGNDPIDNATVRVNDDDTLSVGGQPARDDTIIDLEERTLLPGIINAHSHLGSASLMHEDEMSAGEQAAWIFEHCRRSLALGITTCRETGALDGGVPAAIDKGLARGPRIIPAGPALVQDGGHCDFRPPFVSDPSVHHIGVAGLSRFTQVVNGPDEVRAAARLAFKRGAKFLKMCVTGGVTSLTDSLDETQLSIAEMRAAVDEARARRTYVTVHAHNNDGIMRGLEAGVECFEHVTALDEETASALAAAGAAVVPTLTVAEVYATYSSFLPPDVLTRIHGVKEGMGKAIRVAHDAGILVGCGADLIGPDQRDYGLEVGLVSDVVGPMQALRTATLDNAKVLRIDQYTGSVTNGKIADVIVVDGDPLADPYLLNDPARVKFVMKAGTVEKNILEQ